MISIHAEVKRAETCNHKGDVSAIQNKLCFSCVCKFSRMLSIKKKILNSILVKCQRILRSNPSVVVCEIPVIKPYTNYNRNY